MPALDLSALSPEVTLLGTTIVAGPRSQLTSTPVTGFSDVASATVVVRVERVDNNNGEALSVTVQGSDDGNSWSTVAGPYSFTRDGTESLVVDDPPDRLRVAWSAPRGVREAAIGSVTARLGVVDAPGGGGGGSQSVRLVAVPFAFDSPGLYTDAGFPLFTIAAGDSILDFWLSVETIWNGTGTASGDVASAAELLAQAGLYLPASGSGWPLFNADTPPAGGGTTDAVIPSSVPAYLAQALSSSASTSVPRRYLANTEIVAQAWDNDVDSEGTPAPFGATAGAATAYFVVATPVAP